MICIFFVILMTFDVHFFYYLLKDFRLIIGNTDSGMLEKILVLTGKNEIFWLDKLI